MTTPAPDTAQDRRLTTARTDLRIGLRSLQSAIETDDEASRSGHVADVIQRVEMALVALRNATAKG